jgi:carbamoyl-phosphate synthase large subunit
MTDTGVTVLVTGVGGATGIGAVTALQDDPGYEVVGVDMDATAAGIHLADRGTTVPAAAAESWPDAMAAVVDRHDVDVIVPTVDEELVRLPALREVLPAAVPVVAPRQEVVDLSTDKFRTYRTLREAGHAVPETWLATDADDVDPTAFPLLVKPRRGRGSRGVTRVETPAALEAHLERVDHAPESLLCQEFVAGTEFTTSVIATADDRLLGVVPKEAVEKDGSTVLGATRRAPDVGAACRAVHGTLSPAGPINVQQLVGDDGTVYTIEINPRFSSTSCLTVSAGVDEFDLLIRDALGESVEAPERYTADRYILRYRSHVFVDGAALDSAETDAPPVASGAGDRGDGGPGEESEGDTGEGDQGEEDSGRAGERDAGERAEDEPVLN